MIDTWVEDQKTGEVWRLDHDKSKKVYLNDNDITTFNCRVADVKFYPCCPKSTPNYETEATEKEYIQTDIFDFLGEL